MIELKLLAPHHVPRFPVYVWIFYILIIIGTSWATHTSVGTPRMCPCTVSVKSQLIMNYRLINRLIVPVVMSAEGYVNQRESIREREGVKRERGCSR